MLRTTKILSEGIQSSQFAPALAGITEQLQALVPVAEQNLIEPEALRMALYHIQEDITTVMGGLMGKDIFSRPPLPRPQK
jgi:hypothetical protein